MPLNQFQLGAVCVVLQLHLLQMENEIFETMMLMQQLLLGMSTNVSVLTVLAGTVAGMSTMHAYRRAFGTRSIYNTGQYENVLHMMDAKPEQFYELFRMAPTTFRWFRDLLWEDVRRKRKPQKSGPRPRKDVFERRLLITIFFLAQGVSYARCVTLHASHA